MHKIFRIFVLTITLILASCSSGVAQLDAAKRAELEASASEQGLQLITHENASNLRQLDLELLPPAPGAELAINHSAGLIASATSSRIVGFTPSILVWNLETKELMHSYEGLAQDVTSIAFSPDASMIAASGGSVVKVWDTESGALLHSLEGNNQTVQDIAFSPDGLYLASAASDLTVHLWDTATGEELAVVQDSLQIETARFYGISSITFSPDGNSLAWAMDGGTVTLWDVASREITKVYNIFSMIDEAELFGLENFFLIDLTFSANGQALAVGAEKGRVFLIDLIFDVFHFNLEYSTNSVMHTLLFSPDGNSLAFYGRDGYVVWERDQSVEDYLTSWISAQAGGNPLFSSSAMVFTEDNQTIVLNRNRFVHYDSESNLIEQFPLSTHTVANAVAFSANANILASGGDFVFVWNKAESRFGNLFNTHAEDIALNPMGDLLAIAQGSSIQILDLNTSAVLHTLSGHSALIYEIAFSPDGQVLVSGSEDSTIRFWNVATGEEIRVINHTGVVLALTFSPDGQMLASAGLNSTIHLWNPATAEELKTIQSSASTVRALAFNFDGSLLASGDEDDTVRVWDTNSGQERGQIEVNVGITALSFNADGSVLAIGLSSRSEIILWGTTSNQTLSTLSLGAPAQDLAFSPDGSVLVSLSQGGSAVLWGIPSTENP